MVDIPTCRFVCNTPFGIQVSTKKINYLKHVNFMTIQLNADKNLNIHESFAEKLEGVLTRELSRFSDHITRLEVHLSDENGVKVGQNIKDHVQRKKPKRGRRE